MPAKDAARGASARILSHSLGFRIEYTLCATWTFAAACARKSRVPAQCSNSASAGTHGTLTIAEATDVMSATRYAVGHGYRGRYEGIPTGFTGT